MAESISYHKRRPSAPDPGLLSEGLEATASILGVAPDALRWVVGPRVERPRSTTFLLRAVSDSDVLAQAQYKALYPPGFGGAARFLERVDSLRKELRRAPDMTGRLHTEAVHRRVRPARILAVDPDRLTIVTERVEGWPVGSSLYRAMTPRGRAAGLSIATLIGIAVRLIEGTSRGMSIEEPTLSLMRIDRQIRTAEERELLSEEEAARLRVVMHRLDEESRSTPEGVAYVHGDLTTSNVLRTNEGIGLIDFSWRAEVRGYDLAKFVVLLESVAYPRPAWTGALIERLLEGYGDTMAPRSPGWRLVRLQQQLGIAMRMQRPSSRHRRSHRGIGERALESIREEL